jgi:hypothetical protein
MRTSFMIVSPFLCWHHFLAFYCHNPDKYVSILIEIIIEMVDIVQRVLKKSRLKVSII